MAEDSIQPDLKRPLTIGGAIILALILIISHVAAESVGELAESRIREGKVDLADILDQYSSKVSSIVLGNGPKPDKLVEMVRNYFVAPPEMGSDEDIFEWMKGHDIVMSDLRDAKIRKLLNDGRNDYLERRRFLRETEHSYHAATESLYSGFWLSVNGYPTVALETSTAR